MERAVNFKRMVVGLPHSATDYTSVAFTTQLAELLGLDVLGLFVEDENLAGLAALPCVRELRSLGGGWHPIDAAQLRQGTGQAAADARRRFEEAAKALSVGARFNLARGMMADIIHSQSNVDDIIAIIEPKNPAERVTHQYKELVDVAFNAPSATLLVPSHIVRRAGPVIAIASSGQDSSIRAALGIAASIKERLIVLAPPEVDQAAMARSAGTSGVAIDWRPLRAETADAPAIVANLDHRLITLLAAAQWHGLLA